MNLFAFFRDGENPVLNDSWKELTKTVLNDYRDVHVAKFDCSVFRPICQGMGIDQYPVVVWMKKGRIVDQYNGGQDAESLKTYVFVKMHPEIEEIPEDHDEDFIQSDEKIEFEKDFIDSRGKLEDNSDESEKILKSDSSNEGIFIFTTESALDESESNAETSNVHEPADLPESAKVAESSGVPKSNVPKPADGPESSNVPEPANAPESSKLPESADVSTSDEQISSDESQSKEEESEKISSNINESTSAENSTAVSSEMSDYESSDNSSDLSKNPQNVILLGGASPDETDEISSESRPNHQTAKKIIKIGGAPAETDETYEETSEESTEPTEASKVVKTPSKKLAKQSEFLELSASNFTKNLNPIGVTLVMMYATWCHKCDEIRETLKKVVARHQKSSLIRIGEIDCMHTDNEEFCSEQQMQGVPTINVYRNGKLILNDYKGTTIDELEDCFISHLTDEGWWFELLKLVFELAAPYFFKAFLELYARSP